MATKKQRSTSEKQLKAIVKKFEAKLKRADAKAAQWKKKAKQHQAAAASSKARVAKLEKKLAKKATSPASQPEVRRVTEAPAGDVTEGASAAATKSPDDSWTVVQLRAEARSRGLVGASRKSKAELIAALT